MTKKVEGKQTSEKKEWRGIESFVFSQTTWE
jgi:hypothetical protein